MKICQNHFESMVHTFNSQEMRMKSDAELACEILDLIATVCSEKVRERLVIIGQRELMICLQPSSLRISNAGSIWSLLANVLAPSPKHAVRTTSRILHLITSIAGSLVRLRRDLASQALPHFGFVLIGLLRSLITPRPQLGARQLGQVTDMLPWWVSLSEFLGPNEARAVARLLTTLQAKTIPRTFTSKEKEREKTAASLLDAFSKHAGPVIGSHISNLVNPLVVVSSATWDALEPGLFALCDSMGEHGRDALMASGLDTSGRAVMKSIWREYEKQRYTGKG